jgi:hypothetical protein
MTDRDLNARIRASIDKHLPPRRRPALVAPVAEPVADQRDQHPSHYVYVTIVNTGEDCVIEPGVGCSHCNYCKSHGY